MKTAERLRNLIIELIKSYPGAAYPIHEIDTVILQAFEQVAKEHLEQTLIDFTEHAKFADGFDRDIIKSFLNKQQP